VDDDDDDDDDDVWITRVVFTNNDSSMCPSTPIPWATD